MFGDGAYISNINAANVASTKITNGGSYANIATPDGNLVIAIGAGSSVVATFYDTGISTVGNVDVGSDINLGGASINDVNSNGIQLFSPNEYAQLNYNNTSYVWVNSSGVHLETGSYTLELDTSGNVSAPGAISAVGNVYAETVSLTGNVFAGADVSAVGNAIVGNVLTGGFVSASGNVYSLSLIHI